MILHSSHDLPFLPLPNVIDIVADENLAPYDLTTTSFMIPLLDDGSVVMAHNRRRGIEFPGGHKDPGERLAANAWRETVEETGYEVSWIKAIGYQRMISHGIKPQDYRYPHPLSYQQFFTGHVMRFDPYVENDECLNPIILSPRDALVRLSSSRLTLYKMALMASGF